jgi:hypothetical protein
MRISEAGRGREGGRSHLEVEVHLPELLKGNHTLVSLDSIEDLLGPFGATDFTQID